MKPSEFKKIIKEAVKEAFQEELKEILLEAVKSPKSIVTESRDTYAQPYIEKPKQLTASERRNMFGGMLEEMQSGKVATTNSIPFKPTGPVDTINGTLPEGEVGLDMIMGLMNGK
jgi:vacuolar-type H+-ATPase subunit E/Vma4